MFTQGRRRSIQIPYWLESTTKRHSPEIWDAKEQTAVSGPNFKHVVLACKLRQEKGAAPKLAH